MYTIARERTKASTSERGWQRAAVVTRRGGGGSGTFGRLRKSSPASRVGASTWVGIGSRGAGWLVRWGSNRRETLSVEYSERGGERAKEKKRRARQEGEERAKRVECANESKQEGEIRLATTPPRPTSPPPLSTLGTGRASVLRWVARSEHCQRERDTSWECLLHRHDSLVQDPQRCKDRENARIE